MAKPILNDDAAEARRAYQREHYARNKEQYREKMRRYWEKKAERLPGLDTQSEVKSHDPDKQ